MMLSLIFIVGFFSLLLLPITCLSILFSLEYHHHNFSATTSAADKPQRSSIWRLLLMFPGASSTWSKAAAEGKDGAAGVRRLAGQPKAGEEAAECRVCLCKVEEGEEISDLRCNHLFHKVCLDAWIGSGHATCPLCRGRVFSPAVAEGAGSSELLMFQFSSMAGSRRARREGSWWIR